MRIVTLTSVRGAPGVTTTALLLASSLPDAVLVEADLDGGVLAARYGLGREPGLTTFAATAAEVRAAWWMHAQDAGGVAVLVGPDAPATSASLWRAAGERITRTLLAADGIAVVDAGRTRTPTSITSSSDLLAVLVHPVAEELVTLGHRLPRLCQETHGRVVAVLVGRGHYRAGDVEESLGLSVAAHLADDPEAATALRDGGSRARIRRSRLARSVADLSTAVLDALLPVEARR